MSARRWSLEGRTALCDIDPDLTLPDSDEAVASFVTEEGRSPLTCDEAFTRRIEEALSDGRGEGRRTDS